MEKKNKKKNTTLEISDKSAKHKKLLCLTSFQCKTILSSPSFSKRKKKIGKKKKKINEMMIKYI